MYASLTPSGEKEEGLEIVHERYEHKVRCWSQMKIRIVNERTLMLQRQLFESC